MSLKAKEPSEVKPRKPIILISGESGSRKTTLSLDFPKPYLFDIEVGATRQQYQDKLKKAGGVYFGKEEGAQDFDVVIEETKQLSITKHPYKTAIYDSFSYLYLLEASEAELSVGSDFGRDKREANKPTRQLMRNFEKLDMNIILICHSKGKWGRKGKEIFQDGTTFDGYDKLEYLLDLWIETSPDGKTFTVRKSRIDAFPKGESFPLSYEKFAELYGKDILEKEAVPIVLANHAQLVQLEQLIETLNIPKEQQEKVLKQFDVDSFKEMTGDQIQKVIDSLQKKIKSLTTATKEK